MPRVGRPSRTPTPRAGPAATIKPKTDSSSFALLREMLEEDRLCDSDSDSSTHSDYNFNNDSDMVASSMLPIFASGEKKKPKKKQGKGKTTPAPRMITSSGASKTQHQQKQMESESFLMDEEQSIEDMPQDVAEKIVGMAVIKVMQGYFTKLHSKMDNLKTEVSMLQRTVASLVEENKQLGEVRRHAPDPEMQQQTTARTPTKNLTIRPRQQLKARKCVGTPLAKEILTRIWAKQIEEDDSTLMNIDESDAEPGRPPTAPRLTSPPHKLIHSRYAGASVTGKRREDVREETDRGNRTLSEPTSPKRQRRR